MLKKISANLKDYEVLMLVIWFIFIFVLLFQALNINTRGRQFPLLIALVTLVLVMAQSFTHFRIACKSELGSPVGGTTELEDVKGNKEEAAFTRKRLLGFVGLLFIYWILIRIFGYYTSTFVFLAACMWHLGYKKKITLLITSAATVVMIYLLFSWAFHLRMPQGLLF